MPVDMASTGGATDAAADDAAWRELAAAAARRTHPDITPETVRQVLTRTTVEGLAVPVLATAATAGEPVAGPVPTSDHPGWDVRSLIVLTDAAEAAGTVRRELSGGATSVWLRLPSGAPIGLLADALADIPLEGASIVVDADDSAGGAAVLVRAADAAGARPALSSVVGVDPFAATVRSGGRPPGAQDVAAAVRGLLDAADAVGTRAVVVDGSAAHDAGAGDAAELGWALAVGVALLREIAASPRDLADAVDALEFRLAATVQLYPTIAKFRAARRLWARVTELCGVDGARQRLHAVTSRPMMTRQDPETNLLRTTVAAFAAGVGGADAVTVLPYDHAVRAPGAAARRWARNISHLLLAESHAGQTVDPGAGAFAVEELTATLADAAWAEFQLIEAAGGALAALADGSAAGRWAATAAERDRRIADGRQPLIGVTVHPPATPDPVGPPPETGWPPPRAWEPDSAPRSAAPGKDVP